MRKVFAVFKDGIGRNGHRVAQDGNESEEKSEPDHGGDFWIEIRNSEKGVEYDDVRDRLEEKGEAGEIERNERQKIRGTVTVETSEENEHGMERVTWHSLRRAGSCP